MDLHTRIQDYNKTMTFKTVWMQKQINRKIKYN